MLRRLFTSQFEESWPLLSLDVQNGIKQEMLVAVKDTTFPALRKKTCDAAAELARRLVGMCIFFPTYL
jgi:hypothetical protein